MPKKAATHLNEATPRSYQEELFQKSTTTNCIAVLGTGTGKTLIAVMLIKYMLQQKHSLIGTDASENTYNPSEVF
jgi:endoribonuclease Dicer